MVSLGTVVLNSRDQQRKLWLPKVTQQHNLVIVVTQYSSHRSTGTVLLIPIMYSNIENTC